MFDIALGEFHFSYAAALRTGTTIDGVMNLFRGFVKLTFDEVVRLQPAAEAQVFLALLTALAFDLD